jgi:tRNA 2-thiouridine synthesizing protein A
MEPAGPPLELDMRGRPCPVPIIEAAKALLGLSPGGRLVVHGTDPALGPDLEAFCSSAGHRLLWLKRDGALTSGCIAKGPAEAE